jgi:hypothetical protein
MHVTHLAHASTLHQLKPLQAVPALGFEQPCQSSGTGWAQRALVQQQAAQLLAAGLHQSISNCSPCLVDADAYISTAGAAAAPSVCCCQVAGQVELLQAMAPS